jgi:ABC transporter
MFPVCPKCDPSLKELRHDTCCPDMSASQDVLCGINLIVPAGRIMAITGPSGHGKSTLAALITRLYNPGAGRILLDGCDITTLSPAWLRSAVGVVEQDPVLFSGSIADNILYGRPGSSLEDIIAAAEAANAHQFITEFPDGKKRLCALTMRVMMRCCRRCKSRDVRSARRMHARLRCLDAFLCNCAQATTQRWDRQASSSAAGSGSVWRLRERCCGIHQCCCWTRRPGGQRVCTPWCCHVR